MVGGALVLTSMGYYLYAYYSGGARPDLSGMLVYLNLFAEYGFYMLPVKSFIHPWSMVAIIYVVGVFTGIRCLLEETGLVAFPGGKAKSDKETNTLVLVFVLGIGLFGYYVGRSHDLNLIGPSWPAVLLLTIATDRLFCDLSREAVGQSLRVGADAF